MEESLDLSSDRSLNECIEADTDVSRWMITHGADVYRQGLKTIVPR